MAYKPSNFLLSLAAALAAESDGVATLGGNLFIHQLPADSPSPAAVLRAYGSPLPSHLRPVPVLSVQCMVHALDATAGLDHAQALYAALHDAGNAGRPRHTWSIPGKQIDASGAVVADDTVAAWDVRLIAPAAGAPGVIGRDDAGRWEIVFNFDIRFSAPE